MVQLPDVFKKNKKHHLITIDDLSFVVFNNEIEQSNVQVALQRSLLVFVLNGKKLIHIPGVETISINTGEAFFAQKGSYLMSERLNENSTYSSLIFFIDDSFLAGFIKKNLYLLAENPTDIWHGPGIYKINKTHILDSSVKSLLPFFSEEFANKKELLRLKFEELFFHLINSDYGKNFLSFLKNIQTSSGIDLAHFMNENYLKPYSFDEFAALSARSLSTFKRDFREIYNIPPKKWINKKRLEYARLLTQTTDKNVTQICFDSGFDNISHCIQLYKKEFGVTPKQSV